MHVRDTCLFYISIKSDAEELNNIREFALHGMKGTFRWIMK